MISSYFYQGNVEAGDIYQLLIKACVQDEGDGRPGIVEGLLKAYISCCEEEDEDHPDNLTFLEYEEAEKYYTKMFVLFHNKFADWEYVEGSGAAWWPESMPYGQRHVYPKRVLKEVARVMASGHVVSAKAFYAYCQKREAEKAAKGVKND
jgi:hypothetical protein